MPKGYGETIYGQKNWEEEIKNIKIIDHTT